MYFGSKNDIKESLLDSRDSQYEGGVPALQIPDHQADSSDMDDKEEVSARGVGIEEFRGLEQFSKYREMFFDLTKRSFVDTGLLDCV